VNVAIITNIYTPYRMAQFSLFKEKIEGLSVYFSNKDLQDREWNKKEFNYYHTLKTIFNFGKYGKLNSGLIEIVKKNDIIILGGYEQPSYILLSILCRIFKKPYVILFDGISPMKIKFYQTSNFKHFIKKLVIKYASAYFINGQVSRDYFYKIFKVPDYKIFNQYLSIDRNLFLVNGPIEEITLKVRKDLNITNKEKVIVYSGRLIEGKNIKTLIEVISQIENQATLLVLGNGVELEGLKKYSSELNVRAIFLGNVQVEELFKYYFISDLMVLPSFDDAWGLVINEAIFCSLPVLVSNAVGCVTDLIKDGHNGFVFDINDKEDFKLKFLKSLELNKAQVREYSAYLAGIWNLNNSLDSFISLLNYLQKVSKNRIVE
jgi:glycosyltransferase involved in cell wall biosynthesis